MPEDNYDYKSIATHTAHRDVLIMNAIKKCAELCEIDVNDRRLQSDQLHEMVSLFLDMFTDQRKEIIELKSLLQQEEIRTKMWMNACDELVEKGDEK